MAQIGLINKSAACAGIALIVVAGISTLAAQGSGRTRTAQAVFTALDADGNRTLTRSEIESGFTSWFKSWNSTNNGTLTHDQIAAGLSKVVPGDRKSVV